jgi:hypothetical protein
LVVVAVTVLGGCGPAVPQKELGETVFEVPEVAGAEEPYELPEIEPNENQAAEISQNELFPEAEVP